MVLQKIRVRCWPWPCAVKDRASTDCSTASLSCPAVSSTVCLTCGSERCSPSTSTIFMRTFSSEPSSFRGVLLEGSANSMLKKPRPGVLAGALAEEDTSSNSARTALVRVAVAITSCTGLSELLVSTLRRMARMSEPKPWVSMVSTSSMITWFTWLKKTLPCSLCCMRRPGEATTTSTSRFRPRFCRPYCSPPSTAQEATLE
mmetsp:Transcript_24993/g.35890  ORF Transcript_24993/g.35890 Transcript_24993/m.35890 type:complete len:202 (-) Transcript_24993:180-785(-)